MTKYNVAVHVESQPDGVEVEVLGLGVVENGGSFVTELTDEQKEGLEANPAVEVTEAPEEEATPEETPAEEEGEPAAEPTEAPAEEPAPEQPAEGGDTE